MLCKLCELKEGYEGDALCYECAEEIWREEQMEKLMKEEYINEKLEEAWCDSSVRCYDEYEMTHVELLT